MILYPENKRNQIHRGMSTLLELSLNSCLKSWRFLFVNPEASCRTKWPDSETLIAVLDNVGHKINPKDLKGVCTCMMNADPSVNPFMWLRCIINLNKSKSNKVLDINTNDNVNEKSDQDNNQKSDEYYDLIREICSKIVEKKSLAEWNTVLGYLDIKIVSAMRHIIIPEYDVLGKFLVESLHNDVAIELICHFGIDECVDSLLKTLIMNLPSKYRVDNEKIFDEILSKWRMPVKCFPKIAEALYDMELDELYKLKITLADVPATNENAAKYHKYLMKSKDLCVMAIRKDIKLNIDKTNMELCSKIFYEKRFTSDMVKYCFDRFPEQTLNDLSPLFEDINVSKWNEVKPSIFVLKGILDPIEKFSQKDMDKIVDKYWSQIKEDICPDQDIKFIKTIDGKVTMTKNPKVGIEEHLDKLFKRGTNAETSNNQPQNNRVFINQNDIEEILDDWRYDPIVRRLYDAYEKAQALNRGKSLRNFIEYMKIFADVDVQNLTYSGVPTSRTIITISNININIMSRMHPKVILNTLTSISENISWKALENSSMEFYSGIPETLYVALEEYRETFSRFGFNLEDVVVRKATEEYQALGKMLTRQVSKKGSSEICDSKWKEILQAHESKIDRTSERYRLLFIGQSPEIIDNLNNLKTESQIKHICNITYIYAGLDIKWKRESLLSYITDKRIISNVTFNNLASMFEKSGFVLSVSDNIWRVTGIYNNYSYIPISVHIAESLLDDAPEIPLDQKYSKDLTQRLVKLITNAKLTPLIKGSLTIAFMRARTTTKDGTLTPSIVNMLESLVKNTIDIKTFKEELKTILPEYTAH